MYGLTLQTGPASEPVTTGELKAFLRLNTTAEDTLLNNFVISARQLFEGYTNRQIIQATWRLHLDAFPRQIRLPRAPLQSVTYVKYWDTSDTQQTWDSSKYVVDDKREPSRIIPVNTFPPYGWIGGYPALSVKKSPKIEIEFVAGYSTVPQLIKQGIMLLAANFFENRSQTQEKKLEHLPLGFQAIVNQYKLGWVGNMNEPYWSGIE